MIFRLPKTRSMDNLLSAFENGLPLTRTSSDPNLNKHCQEGLSSLEPSSATEEASADISNGPLPDTHLDSSTAQDKESCEDSLEEPCLTTQPLPFLPLPPARLCEDVGLADSPDSQHNTDPPVPPRLFSESPCRTAESAVLPSHESEPSQPIPCIGKQSAAPTSHTSLLNGDHHNHFNSFQVSADLLALKQLTPVLLMEDSTETLTGEGDHPSTLAPTVDPHNHPDEELQSQEHSQSDKEDTSCDLVKEQKHVSAAAAFTDSPQNAARQLISQSHLSDLSILGSHWDSIQGLVQSACSHSGVSRALHPNSYQSRRLSTRLLRAQGFAFSRGPQCCCREALCSSSSQPGLHHSARIGPAISLNGFSVQGHQILPMSYASPSTSCSPPPPQAPAYLDDDGLPVPMDAVQQRLRQIEAGYKQEVEVLRQQVRQLQMRLESKQYSSPPSEPDIDYEDDIVRLVLSILVGTVMKCSELYVAPCLFLSLCRPVCVSLTTATRRILCRPTARTVCPRAAGTEWSPRTLRSASSVNVTSVAVYSFPPLS